MAICMVTRVPFKVPTAFSLISSFTNGIELLVKQIHKYPPSLKWLRKTEYTPDYEIRSSTMLCPCAVSGCYDTYVFVFHVRRMKDYLNAIGSVLTDQEEIH